MNVLFLCTGNSCRSQMAEGFAKKMLSEKFYVYSAGVHKHGINPYAIRVMKEEGIDISNQESKTTSELPKVKMDYVITVCSDAQGSCPSFPGSHSKHHTFEDPPQLAKNISDEEKILSIYRQVRDQIKEMVENLKQEID